MSIETLPFEAPSRQRMLDPKPIRRKLPLQFRSTRSFQGSVFCFVTVSTILLVLAALGAGAQEVQEAQSLSAQPEAQASPSAEPDETLVERSESRIEISAEAEEVAESTWWVEVTPLIGDAASELHRLGRDIASTDGAEDGDAGGSSESESLVFEPKAPTGPAMVCFGASGFAVSCERHFLYRSVPFPGPAEQELGAEQDVLDDSAPAASLRRDIEASDLTVLLQPVRGRSTAGRVIQDGLPVAEARIYLTPADLTAERPFTVPWSIASDPTGDPVATDPESPTVDETAEIQAQEADAIPGVFPGLRRFVRTDDRGQFEIPPTAAGDYVLEAHLPTAQLHRVAFTLPEPDPLEDPEAAAASTHTSQFPFQLGDIDVPAGLSLEVRAIDQDGGVIEGVRVLARQGFDPVNWTELRARSDGDGLVKMSGLSAELPVVISCDAQGFMSWQQEFELLPVSVDCELSELASVVGVVSAADFDIESKSEESERGSEDLDTADTEPGLVVTVSAASGAFNPVTSSVADPEGNFALHGLSPGNWRLTLAAPGFEPWQGEVSLEAGQTLDIGLVFLPAAPTLVGRVVAAEDGSPIAGASIQVIEPEGLAEGLSNGQGEFELSAGGNLDMVLRVASPERPAVDVVWDSAAQKAADPEPHRTVTLARGGWIRAMVGDTSSQEGRPCVGCALSIVPASLIASEQSSGFLAPIPGMETDSRGEALSAVLPPGGYWVEKPRFDVTGTTVVETRDAERKFVRVKADEITTVRFDTGRPLFQLQLSPAERTARSQVIVRGAGTRERAVALGDGRFQLRRIGDLPPDVFLHRWNDRTQFDEQIYLGTLGPVDGPAMGSGTSLGTGFEQAAPEKAEPEVVHMELSASVVLGRLETIDGERVSGVRIRLRDVAGNRFLAELRSHDDGTFRIEDMAPGVYSLVIGERAYQFVSIAAGRTVDLGVFQLIPGAY